MNNNIKEIPINFHIRNNLLDNSIDIKEIESFTFKPST
jgi:hypothetical protein